MHSSVSKMMGELSEVEAQGVSNGVCSVRFPAVDATTDWLPCEKDLKFNDIVCLCIDSSMV